MRKWEADRSRYAITLVEMDGSLSLATPSRKHEATTFITFLLCAALIGCCQPNEPNCRNVSIGPSGAEVAGVAIGVGAAAATVIAVEVHHAHHTLNGCVSGSPARISLQTQRGAQTYVLSGNLANVTPGERVRVHGTRIKQDKRSTSVPTFLVESKTKDYGPCKLKATAGNGP